MNIVATELRKSLKIFGPVKSESYQIGPHGISAQDSDVWIVEESPLSGLGDCFSINGKKLAQVTNRMSGQIEITREEKFLTLRSAKAKIDLEIQNTKPPKLPEFSEKFHTLDLSEFKKAIALSSASASPNKSAPFGGVVLLQSLPLGLEETSPSGYRSVGTNGNVLTVLTVSTPLEFEFKSLLNLSATAVVQIMDGTRVDFGESNSHVCLRSGGVTLFASKPSQVYPNFDGLLAIPPKLKFSFKSEEWLSALRTVEPLIDSSLDQGGITVQFREGVVQYSTVGVGSTATDEATYEQIEPDPLFEPVTVDNLRINASYLSGFLSKAGETATIGLVNQSKPVKLESGNMMTLVMPIATKKVK